MKNNRLGLKRLVFRPPHQVLIHALGEQLEKRNLMAGLPTTIARLPDPIIHADSIPCEVSVLETSAAGLAARASDFGPLSNTTTLLPHANCVEPNRSAVGGVHLAQSLNLASSAPVNRPPVIANLGGKITYLEGSAPVRLAANLLVRDSDSVNFSGGQATIRISSGAEATDRLVILPSSMLTVTKTQLSVAGTLVATYSGGEGSSPLVINFNNLAAMNRVQQILRNVAFISVADEPSLLVRGVDLQVADGAGGVSLPIGKQIEILPFNDAPLLSSPGEPVTYTEQAAPVRISSSGVVADPDSPNYGDAYFRIRFQSGFQRGDELRVLTADGLSITGSSLRMQNELVGFVSGGLSGVPLVVKFISGVNPAMVQTILRNVAFQHTTSAPTSQPRVLSMLVHGDGQNSAALNQQVNVVPINNAPEIGGIAGVQSYLRNGAPVFIASAATVADLDHGNFNNGKLTVRFSSGENEGNRLLVGGGFAISAGNRIWWRGTHIGTVNANGGVGFTDLEITFTSKATSAIVQQLMRALQFRTINVEDTLTRTLEFQLTDGSGGTSGLQTKQLVLS